MQRGEQLPQQDAQERVSHAGKRTGFRIFNKKEKLLKVDTRIINKKWSVFILFFSTHGKNIYQLIIFKVKIFAIKNPALVPDLDSLNPESERLPNLPNLAVARSL
jgi:hypothetical protein